MRWLSLPSSLLLITGSFPCRAEPAAKVRDDSVRRRPLRPAVV